MHSDNRLVDSPLHMRTCTHTTTQVRRTFADSHKHTCIPTGVYGRYCPHLLCLVRGHSHIPASPVTQHTTHEHAQTQTHMYTHTLSHTHKHAHTHHHWCLAQVPTDTLSLVQRNRHPALSRGLVMLTGGRHVEISVPIISMSVHCSEL